MNTLSATGAKILQTLQAVGLAGLALVAAVVLATVTALFGLLVALLALTLPLIMGNRRAPAAAKVGNRTLEAHRTPNGWSVDGR
jgi:hypothetical protein